MKKNARKRSRTYAKPEIVKIGSVAMIKGFNGKLLDTVYGGHC